MSANDALHLAKRLCLLSRARVMLKKCESRSRASSQLGCASTQPPSTPQLVWSSLQVQPGRGRAAGRASARSGRGARRPAWAIAFHSSHSGDFTCQNRCLLSDPGKDLSHFKTNRKYNTVRVRAAVGTELPHCPRLNSLYSAPQIKICS